MTNLSYTFHNFKFSSKGSLPQLTSKYDKHDKFAKS